MAGVSGGREWALRIEKRFSLGEPVPRYAVDLAESVLDRKLLRGGSHARRPDAKDLQAGDMHDESAVAL